MNFIVRKGEKKDASACYELIKELALFEKEPDAVKNTLEQFTIDGFGAEPVFQLFVAEAEEKVVGMALYFTAYSTWKGKMLYLDDLVVNINYRAFGIGSALIKALMKRAKELDAKIVKWQVLNWNEPAIEFYKKMDMTFDNSWIECKFYEEDIERFNAS